MLWAIIGISLVVALAVTFISSAISQETLLGPKTSSANAYVKAHSCDADGTCEINNAQVSGNLIVEGIIENDLNIECGSFRTEEHEEERGLKTCINNGYTSCILEEYYKQITYLDSVNDRCSGEIQSESIYPAFRQCPVIGGGGGFGCAHTLTGVEPFYGDALMGDYVDAETGKEIIPPKVICCRQKA